MRALLALPLIALLVLPCLQPEPPPPAARPSRPESEELALLRRTPATERRALLARGRAAHIGRLRGYAARGEFPLNDLRPGERVPILRDTRGALCAVAFLMVSTGAEEVVDRASREDDHVRIADVRDGPLLDWILASGLTQAECARIQPSYDWREGPDEARRTAELVERRRIHAQLVETADWLEARTDEALGEALARLDARFAP